MHQRRTIREKIVSVIKAANTSVGQKVYNAAALPSWEENLPVAIVYTEDETAEKFDETPRTYKRFLRLKIEIKVQAAEESVANTLDDIAEEIENAVHESDDLGELLDDIILIENAQVVDGSGSKPIGSNYITYQVIYYTSTGLTESDGEFKKMNITYNDNVPEGTTKAIDDVTIRA